MLKKTINFEDYNGNKKTEEHYFHLKKTKLMEERSDPMRRTPEKEEAAEE